MGQVVSFIGSSYSWRLDPYVYHILTLSSSAHLGLHVVCRVYMFAEPLFVFWHTLINYANGLMIHF